MLYRASRGQTIPVWTFGIVTTLMLMMMVFNYANTLRWQIRAQNAADAVAQGIMSVQTQHYNKMLADLHAAAIEETRIRRIMQSLLLVLHGSGGCSTGYNPTPNSGSFGWSDCATVYSSLRNNYIAAVGRYTVDVQNIAAIAQYTQAQQIADMRTIATSFESNCTSSGPKGGDCAFTYAVANPTARPSLSGALADAGGEDNGNGRALPGTIASDLNPLQIEVTACAAVNSPFASFFKLGSPPYVAIGRAAATATMVTQEWFAPGVLANPNSAGSAYFQPSEFPESSTNTAPSFYSSTNVCNSSSSSYDWYAVRWCSNAYTSIFATPNPGSTSPPQYGGYTTVVQSDEYSTWTGWWSAVPVPPYNGLFTPTATNCKQNVSAGS